MDIIEFFLLLFVLISSGFGIFYMFGKELNAMVPIIIGVIAAFIIWFILSNKGKKNGFLKKHEKILNTIALVVALVVAFIGGLLWATGEWMVYAGLDEHPLLDPVGALSAASGSLMSLILYVNS